jgi:predicted restriction endonuclease
MAETVSRFGEPHLIRPRLGQGAFRVLVTDIYQRRCAVTQERTLPALEAAHIRPYGDGGEHEARNGLLLRRDIHSLLVQNDGPMLEALKRLNGETIHLPNRNKDRPDRDRLALRFQRFKAAA